MDPISPRGVKRPSRYNDLIDLILPPKKPRLSSGSSRHSSVQDGQGDDEMIVTICGVVKQPRPKRVKGKAGKYAFILRAPTEIVLQIMSHLWPVDILNLSYADKELRAMLTAPNNKFIWEKARANVPGLPYLPPDFTEWGYAKFLWINLCDICGARVYMKEEMAHVRVRLCGKCSNLYMIDLYMLRHRYIALHWDRASLLPNDRHRYFAPSAQRLAHRIEEMGEGPEFQKFEKERQELVIEVAKHGYLLERWIRESKQAAKDHVAQLQLKRKDVILERMKDLGYERQDLENREFQRHRLLNTSEEITNRNWPKLQKALEDIVGGIRSARLGIERQKRNVAALRNLYCEYWLGLPDDVEKYTMPPVLDFMDFPSCKRLLERCSLTDTNIRDGFQLALPGIASDIQIFRAEIRHGLFLRWDNYERDQSIFQWDRTNAGKNDFTRYRFLRRATTVFVCSHCRNIKPIHYDSLFSHAFHPHGDPGINPYPKLAMKWSDIQRMLTVRTDACDVMESIVKHAKLDADTTTIGQLDRLGAVFSRPNEDRRSGKIGWRELYRELMILRSDPNEL
ncbi:hypothetical protein CALCODRAFT_501995 [Calocera cornea HHB12733]|uniref:F-box domain-containing protein n=1 Tax=Calocera cornea HHB12733 TaxID=1353952 RepID=A0A165DES8_9BASI|nr:hypothetical protein CALCODRAFT_501995 [Calocera cornea HHB12733]